MRRYSGGQTDQGEVLDDCCHVTSALGTLRSEVTLLHSNIKLELYFEAYMTFSSVIIVFPL